MSINRCSSCPCSSRTQKRAPVLLLLLLLACSALHTVTGEQQMDAEQQATSEQTKSRKRGECSQTCEEHECDNVGLNYGKYCGVAYGGCPGEEPCDAADACCKEHDECVGKKHVFSSDCHADFIACLDQVMLSGQPGFSKKCPYSMVVPTMRNGIEMTMMLGDMVSNLYEGATGAVDKETAKQRFEQQKDQAASRMAEMFTGIASLFEKKDGSQQAAIAAS